MTISVNGVAESLNDDNDNNKELSELLNGLQNDGPQQSSPQGRAFGLTSKLSMSMPKSMGSENIKKVVENINNIYEDTTSIVRVASLDPTINPDLSYTYLLFTLDIENPHNTNEAITFYSVALLSKTGKELQPIESNVGHGVKVYYPCKHDLAFNVELETIINEELSKRSINSKLHIPTVNIVISKDVDLEDSDNLFKIAREMHEANVTSYKLFAGEGDVSLAADAQAVNGRVKVLTEFKTGPREPITDGLGEISRADIVGVTSFIDGTERTNRNNVNYVVPNSGTTNHEKYSTNFIMDYIMNKPQQPIDQNGNRIVNCFTPNIVITGCESSMGYTNGVFLLSILNAVGLSERKNYVQFCTAPKLNGSVNTRDTGFLNYIAKLGMPDAEALTDDINKIGEHIDTTSIDFNLQQLYAYLGKVLTNQTVISVDVKRGGSGTFWMQNFVDACIHENPETRKDAYNVFYESCVTLVGPEFRDHFPHGTPLVANGGHQQLHGGHYESESDGVRDIRDIDMLAVIAMYGETNTELVREYMETFVSGQQHPHQRQHRRLQILNEITRNTFNHTCWIDRLTLNGQLVNALVACSVSVMGIVTKTPVAANALETSTVNFGDLVNNAMINTDTGLVSAQNWGNDGNLGNYTGSTGFAHYKV